MSKLKFNRYKLDIQPLKLATRKSNYLSDKYFRPTLTPNEDKTMNPMLNNVLASHAGGFPCWGVTKMVIIPAIPNNIEAEIKILVASF